MPKNMPEKIRDLLKGLRKAGFELDRQKGSHRQFRHPPLAGVINLAGAVGDDDMIYQERQAAEVIAKSKPKE